MKQYFITFFIFSIIFSCNNLNDKNILDKTVNENITSYNQQFDSLNSKLKDTLDIQKLYKKYLVDEFSENLIYPNFNTSKFKNDNEFIVFITENIKSHKETNFAGIYSIISRSCGLDCTSIFIINRKTGKFIENLPQELNEENNGVGFQRNSKLIINNINSINESTKDSIFKPEFFIIENDIVKKINVS